MCHISVACFLLCIQNDVGIQRVYKKAVQAWSKMLAIKMFMYNVATPTLVSRNPNPNMLSQRSLLGFNCCRTASVAGSGF